MEEAVEESASVEEGEPRGDVHRIELPMEWKPGHVAAYFVEGDENALIDAGVPGEEAEDVLEEKLAG
ncbi:MAG: hydroxyacylglutathione hydrolase, partial [Halobacteria archaeon]|nr:hydroxyacylglutathione hydrolase [Halobacteria archaeon]